MDPLSRDIDIDVESFTVLRRAASGSVHPPGVGPVVSEKVLDTIAD